jgi:hypothetical protein
MFGSFYGYVHLPLATVTALSFTMPFFLAGLSVLMLGERLKRGRMLAMLAGFGGVLVMLRPWQGLEQTGLPLVPVLVVLAGALGWALAMITIRRMGENGESGATIVLWFALGRHRGRRRGGAAGLGLAGCAAMGAAARGGRDLRLRATADDGGLSQRRHHADRPLRVFRHPLDHRAGRADLGRVAGYAGARWASRSW